ncbi:MAG: hypothetical protein E6J81_06030, partial [Deltaproteobacteria bacterium]
VAAGDVLVVIEPETERAADEGAAGSRLTVGPDADPLGVDAAGGAGASDLSALDAREASERRAAITALREEIRTVLLGYDADPDRARRLAALLDSADGCTLSTALAGDLTALKHEIIVFADLEQLFLTAPRSAAGGQVGPSNAARLRGYVRRMRAGGAGTGEDFRALLRAALGHYGVTSLDHGDSLERALLRLFATQTVPDLRRQLVRAVLRCLAALPRAEGPLADDAALADALARIAAMRALVSDALADTAIEAHAVIFESPTLEQRAELAAASWLVRAAAGASPPPQTVLVDLAATPRHVFDRVGRWLFETDAHRRNIALSAYLFRRFAPDEPVALTAIRSGSLHAQRIDLPDGRVVIGVTSTVASVARTVKRVGRAIAAGEIAAGRSTVHAIEVVVADEDGQDPDAIVARVVQALGATALPAERCTVSLCRRGDEDAHRTVVRGSAGACEDASLLGMHPEIAARIGFARLGSFVLERLSGADGVYCFWGRSRAVPEDERLFVLAEVRGRTSDEADDAAVHIAGFERLFHQATSALRALRSARDPRRRLHWNRITIVVGPAVALDAPALEEIAQRLAPATRHLGLEKVVVRLRLRDRVRRTTAEPVELVVSDLTGSRMEIAIRQPETAPLEPATDYERKVVEARRRGHVYPYEIVRMVAGGNGAGPAATFEEYDLDPGRAEPRAVCVADRPHGQNAAAVVFGIVSTPTDKVPEGMRRVLILSDPTRGMGALGAPECDRIVAAIDLAERLGLPVEWIPISSGARIAMDSGTENLDATARVARRIITFTERGGVIHLIVYGVNVGAQSYWDALATMISHTRGALVMTPDASMVLTGRAALEASGGVAAEDEVAIGGFERIMGPNGEAQYYAGDLAAAVRTLAEHYRYAYVVPGEAGPRLHRTTDPLTRDITTWPYPAEHGHGFATVGEIFDDATNPGRKRPFAMRAVMQALIDQDGGHLERWRPWAGAETAIVWDAHLGGFPICLIGIESHNVAREGYRPLDGPAAWSGGTLFPLSSKKVARALNAASGNRPAVILANLSGFDGSPESLRRLQLEHGAEIARAVVNFDGPLLFLVVSRYHGGAY